MTRRPPENISTPLIEDEYLDDPQTEIDSDGRRPISISVSANLTPAGQPIPFVTNATPAELAAIEARQTGLARPDSNPKSAFGIKKPSMHLIPGTALMMLAKVMALGAAKYGAYNWRDQPVAATVYISAALRHIYQWLDGEDIDPESGAPHLAHAMADMAILLDAWANGTLIDDRPTNRTQQTTRIINEMTVKEN